MPRVAVIGGGFAGLKAAVDLADAGVAVTVAEARGCLGGRARSFIDPATSEVVDNGQHLFLAGYEETLRFLERLGTRGRVVFQERLRVSFAEPGGKICTLDCPPVAAPWHVVLGLARMGGLSLRDKLLFGRVAGRMRNACGQSAQEWLTQRGQSERARRRFWNPLILATLNEDPSRASAEGLLAVLRILWMSPWPCARLGVASVGLSALYTLQAEQIIEERGGQVLLNRPVVGLEMAGSRVVAVRFADGGSQEVDAVISTLSPSALARLLPALRQTQALQAALAHFTHSPIVSVNLWLDRPVTDHLFVGLLGRRFHWLFNKPAILRPAGIEVRYVSLIRSAAHGFIDQPNAALVEMAMEDLRGCFPTVRGAGLVRSQVVREREATVSLTVAAEQVRPGPKAGIENFFLAGDWTATGLPATIESAVVSGGRAAQVALAMLRSGL